uniref:Major antigen n=1 Tax=Rhabditophanes sp. KR3021 TaxID=114890 RepID=A0AC35U797_9BILA
MASTIDDAVSDSGSVVETTTTIKHGSNNTGGDAGKNPESPGSRSNYGEFYWDTNGETNYHASDSFDSDILFDFENNIGGSGGATRARLDRTQEDLSKYKQRIDANVEQQREYSELMHDMQNKLTEYRKHIAELQTRLGSKNVILDDQSSKFLFSDQPSVFQTDINISDNWTNVIRRDGANNFDGAGLNVNSQLEEERRRYETLRIELENERRASDLLRHELDTIRNEFEREICDKDRYYQNRERNLAQAYSEEQQKNLDMTVELKKVRKQLSEEREKSERELEDQRIEFQRTVRQIQTCGRNGEPTILNNIAIPGGGGLHGLSAGLMDGGNLSGAGLGVGGNAASNFLGNDTVLIEMIKRMRDRGDAGDRLQTDLSFLNQLRSGSGSGDAELYNELMKKYEEAIERNIELESRGDEGSRKLSELESELKRTKDRMSDSQNALRKLMDLCQSHDSENSSKRARSLSPGNSLVQPSEALREVRNFVRDKNNEINQLENKLKVAQRSINDYQTKMENSDEDKLRLEKQLADAKKMIQSTQKTLDDAERSIRKLDDKLRTSDIEKESLEKARKFLEDELKKLQKSFEQTSTDDARKAREDAEDFANRMEEDYKERIVELTRRIDVLQKDNNRFKSELTPIRDKYRDLENEYNNLIRKIEEKDIQISYIDDQKKKAIKEFEEQKELNDALRSELDGLYGEHDSINKNSLAVEQTVKELKTQRDNFNKQREDLTKALAAIKADLERERKSNENSDKTFAKQAEEIEKANTTINDYERQVIILRRHNDELDTQVKNYQAKIANLENDVLTHGKELEQVKELNERLQREKQDILNAKHKTENEMELFKEQIRKLENEIEKLKTENKALEVKEARAVDAQAQQMTRCHILQKELEDNYAELKEFKARYEDLVNDYNALKEKLKTAGKSKHTVTTITKTIKEGGKTVTIGGGPDAAKGKRETIAGDDITSEDQRDGADHDGQPTTDVDGDHTVFDTYHDSEITEIKIREINDRWRREVEKLENEKDELENKIRDFEDQLVQTDRGKDRQEFEFEEMKRKYQTEIDRLKTEINTLTDKHQSELEDEREHYNESQRSSKLIEDELRDKLAFAERKLAEVVSSENVYIREREDYDSQLKQLIDQNSKLREDLEDLKNTSEAEIQTWKNDAFTVRSGNKALETANTTLKSQLNSANDRIVQINKTVTDHVSKIRDLSGQIRKLEEDLVDARSSISSKDLEIDNTQNRLRNYEDQLSQLQLDNNRMKTDLDSLSRENDSVKTNNTTLENELTRLRKKLASAEQLAKEQKNTLDHIKIEREKMQNAYREKSKQLDHLTNVASSYEIKMTKLRKELTDASEKYIQTADYKKKLQDEFDKLTKELNFGKDQMIRKTDEYHTSLEEIANAQRTAEDARLNALQELESKKYELSDCTARLENTEQRLTTLQNEYIKADNEREILSDALKRFQQNANRLVILNRISGKTGGSDAFDGVNADISTISGGGNADDSGFDRSGIQTGTTTTTKTTRTLRIGGGDTGGDGQAGGYGGPSIINNVQGFNVADLENNLTTLMNKIQVLQRERDQYREELNRLQKKTTDNSTVINKQETRYRTIEDNLTEVEDDRRALESKLATAKQMLRVQEDAMKSRDEERRQMKSKMVAAELQARGKEAQLRHLNEQLKNLRTDLANVQEDLRNLRDKEETWDSTKYSLETKVRDYENNIQRLTTTLTTLESEKASLNDKLKELDGKLRINENKASDLKDEVERLRRDLSKAEASETDMKRSLESYSKLSLDYQSIKDQLVNSQNEFNAGNTRRQQLDNEIINLRSEIRDYKNRSTESGNRVSDLQRQLQDANGDKKRLEQRIMDMEKSIAGTRTTETDLRQQVQLLKTERKELQKEVEDMKKRLNDLENDRTGLARNSDQWKKEKLMLIKKIEMMESEKARTDAAIKETALQREAIEKSLNAMERENRELYKNCAQLQQQIAQLEMENGNRVIEMTNKQREEQERVLMRMRNEKSQIEKIIENRERTYKGRIKQLEEQVNVFRDQLDTERKRRRELMDRNLVNDLGRYTTTGFGSRIGSGYNSAGMGGYHGDGIDNNFGGNSSKVFRSTFASNPMTPPRGSSTPTHTTTVRRHVIETSTQHIPTIVDESGSQTNDVTSRNVVDEFMKERPISPYRSVDDK